MTGDTGTRPVLSWLEGPGASSSRCSLARRLPRLAMLPVWIRSAQPGDLLAFCTQFPGCPFSVGVGQRSSDQALIFFAFVFPQGQCKGREQAEEKLKKKQEEERLLSAYVRKYSVSSAEVSKV